MHILISGGTGLLGQTLTHNLLKRGHTISILSRSKEKVHTLFDTHVQHIAREKLDLIATSTIDIVINLAGTSLSHFPWTKKYKQRIYNSRIDTTKKLVAHLPKTCHSFFCASAIGYYPSNRTKHYDESYNNTHPQTFLERVCHDWEEAALLTKTPTRRVIHLRTGLVTGDSPLMHMIEKSITRTGGCILGDGKQWMSIITPHQRVNNVMYIIETPDIAGPVNMVSEQIRHRDFIARIAKKHNRPVWCRIPTPILHVLLGDASQLILDSQRVTSNVLDISTPTSS